MPTYSSVGSVRTAFCLFFHLSRKDTHKNSSPSKLNMAALAYAGVETRSRSRLFPFPDSSTNPDTNINSYRNWGTSARQVHTAEAWGIWTKSPRVRPGEVCGLLVLSLSVLFSHQVSIYHGIWDLLTFTYLNIKQLLSGDEAHPRLLCIKIYQFFLPSRGHVERLKPDLKYPACPLLLAQAD